jgi:hypothetical protein
LLEEPLPGSFRQQVILRSLSRPGQPNKFPGPSLEATLFPEACGWLEKFKVCWEKFKVQGSKFKVRVLSELAIVFDDHVFGKMMKRASPAGQE